MTDDEEFAVDLFRSANEIDHAMMVLRDHEVYVRRFPYANTRVTRVRHLRTTVEAYYQTVYIFRERLRRHVNLIEKHYRGTRRRSSVAGRMKAIRNAIDAALESVLDARGGHVHKTRLSSPDLERIDAIQVLADISDDPTPYNEILVEQYREVRAFWRDRIEHDNQLISELLDLVFKYVRALVVHEGGELRYPSEIV